MLCTQFELKECDPLSVEDEDEENEQLVALRLAMHHKSKREKSKKMVVPTVLNHLTRNLPSVSPVSPPA